MADGSAISRDALVHRHGDTGDFIQVVAENCTGCRDCAVVCPMHLFRMREEVAQLVEDYARRCVECGACYQVCDDDAIRFRMPKGGTGVVVAWG